MNAPLRILMTADAVGGVWTYALELTDALADRGVRVTLAAMGEPLRADQEAELLRSRAEAFHAGPFALEWMPDPWGDVVRAGEWLLHLRDDVQPDLVHLNGYAHAQLPWGVPVLVVAHSCVLSWFEAVRGSPAPPEWDRYREVVSAGIAAADVLAAPTATMLEEVERFYDPPARRLVIPNGRTPVRQKAVAKEPLVVTCGRLWDEAKNVEALVRVAPTLDWQVVLAGDGTSPSVATNLTAVGRLSRPALDRLLARACIFALPARYEPFGLAPLEAAGAGCALVLGDIPSLREVWGDAAVFVEPGDDDSLRDALKRLIADRELRSNFADRAQRQAATYTPERMAAAYLDAYSTLLGPDRLAA